MKLTTEIMIPILAAITFAIGFAMRYILARIYTDDVRVSEITHGSSSGNNIISFSRSTKERNALIKRATLLSADYKLDNIFAARKVARSFVAQAPEYACQAERNVTECFYRLVFSMLANGK